MDINSKEASVPGRGLAVLSVVIVILSMWLITKIGAFAGLAPLVFVAVGVGISVIMGICMSVITKRNRGKVEILRDSLSQQVASYEQMLFEIKAMTQGHLDGHYDMRLNESLYEGALRDIAKTVNGMTFMYVDDYIELLEVVKAYGAGDFDVSVREYQDNWSWANDNIKELRTSLEAVINTVADFSDKAMDGDFGFRADHSVVGGKWNQLIKDLNAMFESIYSPLHKIEENIVIMSEGDFSMLEGEFRGVFKVLQDACNLTNERTTAYVDEISNILEALAQGELAQSFKEEYVGSYYPIRKALDSILESLNHHMRELSVAIDNFAEGSEALSENATKLADESTRQAQVSEHLYSALDIILRDAGIATDTSLNASKLAEEFKNVAKKGTEDARVMLDDMQSINTASISISKIIGVIEDIAFQTQLLSLNAAIEASRAGESGRGFSVVAEKVGRLATRSRESVEEIVGLVKNSRDRTSHGMKSVEGVSSSMEFIFSGSKQTSGLMQKIVDVTQGQKDLISSAFSDIAKVTDTAVISADVSKECARASEEFARQAKSLEKMVHFYKLA